MRLLLWILLALGCVSCSKTEQTSSITVSAAASLKEVLTELSHTFPEKGVTVQFQFAASGELEKQLMGGAPVDVFISASTSQIERLRKNAMLEDDTVTSLATNRLIVITYQKSPLQTGEIAALLSRPEVTRLAIGDPAFVPAGEYAKQGLEALGLWESVSPRLVNAANVRQALDLVSRQEAELGFVYETDLKNRSDVRKVAAFPVGAVASIVYPAAVLKASTQRDASKRFLAFLQSPAAREVFLAHGFGAP